MQNDVDEPKPGRHVGEVHHHSWRPECPPGSVAATPCEPRRPRSRQHDPPDLGQQFRLTNRPGRRPSDLGGVVGARSDLATVPGQHGADRLDSGLPAIDSRAGDEGAVTVLVDDPHERGDGRLNSAKNAEAVFKMGFARRRSSRFSASSFLSRRRSSVKIPGRAHPRAPVREQPAGTATARALSSDRPSTLPPR